LLLIEEDLAKSGEWRTPEPFASTLPEVPAFDPGLLPASIRAWAEDIADRMQVPLDFPAVAITATLAGVCGCRASIQPKELDTSWVVVPNNYGMIVGSPSVLKSPLIASVTAPVRAVEAEWRKQHEEAMKEYDAASERATLDRSVWAEQYKRAAKQGAPAPAEPESSVTKPVRRRLLIGDATWESSHEILAENPGGLYCVRDEMSGLLAGLDRQGREQERAYLLEAWNGDSSFTVDRIGRGCTCVEHVCLSLFGGIQPDRLRGYLADALRNGPSNDGLIQRFQLAIWPDLPPTWRYVDRPPDAAALRTAETIFRRIAEMDVQNPLLLRFSQDAQALFVAWLSELEIRLRSGEMGVFMQSHLAKYRSLMPSLALLFSLADGLLQTVGIEHARQAADWCSYLEHHAQRIYASRATPELNAASDLAAKLKKGWKREQRTFSVLDVYRNCWTGLSTPDEARAALLLLEDAGWTRRSSTPATTGRPSEIFVINPDIGADKCRA
jgi:hypothetical protein